MTKMYSASSNKPYKVRLQRETATWNVVEEPTGLIIASHRDHSRDAKIQANVLNGGAGFRGWTPEYFLQTIMPTGVGDE